MYDLSLPNELGVRCEKEEEVINVIKKIYKNPKPFTKANSLSDLSLSVFKNLHSDTYDDFVRLCQKLVDKKMESNHGTGEISCQKMVVREWVHSLMLFLKSLVRVFFPVRLRKYRDARAVFPGFDKKFVKEKIGIIGKILEKNVSVKYLSERLLVVTGGKGKVR